MHPSEKSKTPGFCRICGMALESPSTNHTTTHTSLLKTYRPLLIIIAVIATTALVATLTYEQSLRDGMRFFMGGFFLVFALFKLIDLKGFADGYHTYDVIAKRIYAYGYVYPFLELVLGLALISGVAIPTTLIATVVLMTISGIGVTLSKLQNKPFKCACLGTAIDLPLGTVTIIEDFGMAAMALAMLFF